MRDQTTIKEITRRPDPWDRGYEDVVDRLTFDKFESVSETLWEKKKSVCRKVGGNANTDELVPTLGMHRVSSNHLRSRLLVTYVVPDPVTPW